MHKLRFTETTLGSTKITLHIRSSEQITCVLIWMHLLRDCANINVSERVLPCLFAECSSGHFNWSRYYNPNTLMQNDPHFHHIKADRFEWVKEKPKTNFRNYIYHIELHVLSLALAKKAGPKYPSMSMHNFSYRAKMRSHALTI